MKNNPIYYKKNITNVLFWCLGIILVLPAILLLPNFSPSDWTRSILLRLAITAVIAFLFFSILYKKESLPSIPKWKNPAYIPLFALLGLCAVMIVSTIFSQDILFSIFGSPVRSGGILNFLFFCLFAIFVGFFVSKERLRILLKINFLIGIISSTVAFIQYFGLLKSVFIKWEAGGPPSLLGNSTFLAIYMLFLAFSALTFFVSSSNKKIKAYYGALFLLFIFTILISGSRATYLGMFIAFIFYGIFFPLKSIHADTGQAVWLNVKKIKILKKIAVACIALIIIGIVYVNLSPKFPKFVEDNQKISYFLHNRLSFQSVVKDLAGTRLSAWTITSQAIKEKPLLGWGPENAYIGFEKYFDPTLPPSLQKLWWDRPHNIFLEVWANSGIFALLFYIAFWALIIWQLQKFKNKSPDIYGIFTAHGIQAMFIGYLTVLSFQFDSFATYAISFFFIGYALHLISSLQETSPMALTQKNIPFKKAFIAFGIILLSLFVWFWNIKPLYLNEKIVYIENVADSKRCKEALTMLHGVKWENYGIIRPYAILKYSDSLKNCAYAEPNKEVEYSKRALSLLKLASTTQPKYTRTWLFMGSFANVLAAREENISVKSDLLKEAQDYLGKAIQLSPKRQELFIEMARSYMLAQDYHAMEKTGQDCVAIDQTNGSCFWYLGIAEIFLGKQEQGKKDTDASKEKGYDTPSYRQLSAAYASQNNWVEAIKAYEHDSPLDYTKFPEAAANYHAALAYLYGKSGNYAKAGEHSLKVFELQPNNPETEQFLRLLLGVSPNSIDLHSYLTYIYKKTGPKEKYQQEFAFVENAYGTLISQHPRETKYRFSLVNFYKKVDAFEKAVDELIIIIKIDPSTKAQIEEYIRSGGGLWWNHYQKQTAK